MERNLAFKTTEGKMAVLQYYNNLLSNLTVPYEEKTIETRFGETFVLTTGNKNNTPIILLHGSSMNSSMWISDIAPLSNKFLIYAVDLPGEPGKSVESQLSFDTDDYSNWLHDVFTELAIEKANIIGASLGAWLATLFSVRHPEKVKKLVLLCPAGIGSQNHNFKDIAMSLLTKGEAGVNELFMKINGDNPIPEDILNYNKLIAACFNSRQETIPIFSDEELKRLTMPCSLFVGKKDIMLNSEETIDRLNQLVPHTEINLLPEKGHSLYGLSDDIIKFIN